ncbi:MAG: DUF1573 domain-containing protein [Planctomycetes bacterium]|nr:DUF1573 domain-containing protein [Planctomycetota bacterium]
MTRSTFREAGTASFLFRRSAVATLALAGVVIFAGANGAFAQAGGSKPATGEVPVSTQPTDAPQISPVEPTHDFGKVWMGKNLKHTFVIKNTGNKPLKITRVKPSCGCTKKGKHPTEIAPGQSGEFTFGLATKKLNGKFTKAITITTNDPKKKSTILKLVGEVQHFVAVKPNAATFGNVKADSILTKTLKVRNNTGSKLSIKLAEDASKGCFVAELAEVVPGMEYELTVRAQPPFANGNNSHTIRLLTDHPDQKEVRIRCRATLPRRLEVGPPRLRIASGTKNSSDRILRFTNNGDSLVHLTSVTTSADTDKLKTKFKALREGRSYMVTVTIPANYTPPASGVSIVLHTDDSETPELKVPIQSAKRPAKPRKTPPELMLGKAAPAKVAKTVAGDEINIGGKSEEVEVIVFYASWCGFCKKALPKLETLSQSLKSSNKKAKIIAINLDAPGGRRGRTQEQSIKHYEGMKLSMPLVLDPTKQYGAPYKVRSFPTMFVVGQSGIVESVHVGARKGFENILAKEIDTLLSGKSLAKQLPEAKKMSQATAAKVKGKSLEVKQATVGSRKAKGAVRTVVGAEGVKSKTE